MSEQRQIHERQDREKIVPPSGDQGTRDILDTFDTSALDALLDEIDRTLEEGTDLAKNFIQRGGE